jgi:hypothetical protein
MKPSFGTDLTSFLGIAIGTAAGIGLTAAFVTGRASHAHDDIHYDGRHSVSVVVDHHGEHQAVMEHEQAYFSKLHQLELAREKARLEGRRLQVRVEPRIRVERREPEQRR